MPFDLNNFTTGMGWNQVVQVDFSDASELFAANGEFTAPSTEVFRVESYNIGVSQTAEAPDYVTGRQDHTAWRKGPILSEGDLSFPFMLPQGSNVTGGFALFLCGAELVKRPGASFTVQSSAHPSISGCKVQNARIDCTSEGPVNASATVWGIVDQEELATIHSYGDAGRYIWGRNLTGDVNPDYPQTYLTFGDHINTDGLPGQGEGADVSGSIILEQIPMFDIVSVEGAPSGMFVTGFSLEINNNLQRNYTMGSGSTGSQLSQYSPFGLNATSISAGQRRITGTLTWQSDYEGYISQILGAGIDALTIRVGPVQFTLNQVVWNAQPPTLSAGDRMTVESSFTALGTGTGSGDDAFDALVVEANTNLPEGL